MHIFDRIAERDHEQVVFCYDPVTGLRAIVAIHDTTLGPALGGTRMWVYEDDGAAVEDALRLARGMTYKSAAAGLNLGGGKAVIIEACERLGGRIQECLDAYGAGNEARLTGAHETCSYKEFRYGIADRTASIRIPRLVETEGRGYLEDRRPAANADPYEVCEVLLKTTLDLW